MGAEHGTYLNTFWWRNVKERLRFEDRRKWEDDMKVELMEIGEWAWSRLAWLRMVPGGGLL